MIVEKLPYLCPERKGTNAKVIYRQSSGRQSMYRLDHSPIGASKGHNTELGRSRRLEQFCRRYQRCRRVRFTLEPFHQTLIVIGIFSVSAVLVVARPTSEVGTFSISARIGAIANAIAVQILVA